MQAITPWQPWASLIAFGRKKIETRTHDGFAGLVGQRIAIHAGQHVDWPALVYVSRCLGLSVAEEQSPRRAIEWGRRRVVCTAHAGKSELDAR